MSAAPILPQEENQSEPVAPHGVLSIALLTTSIILGSGIFSLPAVIAKLSPDTESFLAVWLLAGAISFVGLLAYAELARTHPESGGDAIYLRKELHPLLGDIFLWAECLVIRPGAMIALLLTAFAYCEPFIDVPRTALLGLLLVGTIGFHLLGRTINAKLSSLLSIAKLILIILLIASAFRFDPHSTTGRELEGVTDISVALALTLFVFGGWSEITFMMGEVRGRSRGYLLGGGLGLGLITAIYTLLMCGIVSAIGFEGLREGEAPFRQLLVASFGTQTSTVFAGIIALCCLGSAHAVGFAGIPLYRRLLPSPRIRPELVQLLICVAFLLIARDVQEALLYTTPLVWMFGTLTGIAGLKVSVRQHRWVQSLAPLIFTATALFLCYRSTVYAPQEAMIAFAIVALTLMVRSLVIRPKVSRKEG